MEGNFMKKKLILFSSAVVLLTFGFLYVNHSYLSAGSDDGKSGCTSSSSCVKYGEIKAGGEFETYEFVTDKACCDEMKTSLKTGLMSISGVKDVKFGHGCSMSKMTRVSVNFAGGETNKETIEAYILNNKLDCPDTENCPKGKCDPKSKSKDTKDI